MEIKTSLLVTLVLSMPAIPAEYSGMKMGDTGSSAPLQAHMSGINEMYKKMMAAVKEPDPDKAFAEGMAAHHEGTIAMAKMEFKYGKDPGVRELVEDITRTQKGEIGQISKWLDSQK